MVNAPLPDDGWISSAYFVTWLAQEDTCRYGVPAVTSGVQVVEFAVQVRVRRMTRTSVPALRFVSAQFAEVKPAPSYPRTCTGIHVFQSATVTEHGSAGSAPGA